MSLSHDQMEFDGIVEFTMGTRLTFALVASVLPFSARAVLAVCVQPIEACGVLVAGESDACPVLFQVDGTGAKYHLNNTGGFSIGCHVRVIGFIDACGSLGSVCNRCTSCNADKIAGCVCIDIIVCCNIPEKFAGCGTIIAGTGTDCPLLFQADENGLTYVLDNFGTAGSFEEGCRVEVTGVIFRVCDNKACEFSCDPGNCIVTGGCIQNNTITSCPGPVCSCGIVEIASLEVLADTDPFPGAGCSDVFVEMALLPTAPTGKEGCEPFVYVTGTEGNQCPGSNPHEGLEVTWFSPNPVELTSIVWDDDVLSDDDMSGIACVVDTTAPVCDHCGSCGSPAVSTTMCVTWPLDCETLGIELPSVSRTLPDTAFPGMLIPVELILKVARGKSPDRLTLREQLPSGFAFQGAFPRPDEVRELMDSDGSLGTVLTWEFVNPDAGEEIPITYEVLTPADPQLIRQPFSAMVIQDGRALANALPASSIVIGGVLHDCNDNGIEDLIDIAEGRSADINKNNVPDECEEISGLQRPGNCNQDADVDISDAVCLFGFLFLGNPEALPCGDGLPTHVANIALMDWNNDGFVDISDGIGLLQFLFRGGPPHPLGTECPAIVGCPNVCVP